MPILSGEVIASIVLVLLDHRLFVIVVEAPYSSVDQRRVCYHVRSPGNRPARPLENARNKVEAWISQVASLEPGVGLSSASGKFTSELKLWLANRGHQAAFRNSASSSRDKTVMRVERCLSGENDLRYCNHAMILSDIM